MTTDWLAKYDTGEKGSKGDSDFPYGVSKCMKYWLIEKAKKEAAQKFKNGTQNK